jgi:hypothetical protein
MRTWKLCCLAGGLLASLVLWTAARGQSPQEPTAAKPPEPAKVPAVPFDAPNQISAPLTGPVGSDPTFSTIPAPAVPMVSPPAPQPQSIDEMLNQLADIRAKKAELEKQEQATIKVLRERLKAQKERLAKMGVSVEDVAPKPQLDKADLDIGPTKAADKK